LIALIIAVRWNFFLCSCSPHYCLKHPYCFFFSYGAEQVSHPYITPSACRVILYTENGN
jgi:hypothetical protein